MLLLLCLGVGELELECGDFIDFIEDRFSNDCENCNFLVNFIYVKCIMMIYGIWEFEDLCWI